MSECECADRSPTWLERVEAFLIRNQIPYEYVTLAPEADAALLAAATGVLHGAVTPVIVISPIHGHGGNTEC